MLSFVNLSKGFSGRVLFDNISFTLNSGERVGLVGRNGHGKTTLLNIIVGLESSDSGSIIFPKGYKVGYLTQKISFLKPTVREEGISSLPEDMAGMSYLAEKILFGLGFTSEDLVKSPSELSGGFQVRLNLAKLLTSSPDLLIMDEPTNYLDIVSIRWLEGFLKKWKGELLFVTHDRSFMDNVATHIAGIHRQKLRKIEGVTDKYYAQIASDEEVYEKTRLNDEAKRKDMELYISRFRAKARMASRVQSRMKVLEKMELKEKLKNVDGLEFAFQYKDTVSDNIILANGLTFGYDQEKPLFSNLSFTVDKGDCLCVIGKNGAGKSTLLKILSNKLNASEGSILIHQNAAIGYFEQTNINNLNPSATVEDEIGAAAGYKLDRTKVRNICASMLFIGDDALKKNSVLSGGEKCRVMLGKILACPCTCLLLDEPTNHLDMDASDALMEAVSAFGGGTVIVTHNESYLHGLATKLIVFQGDNPFFFDGTYAEFLEKIGWEKSEWDDGKKEKVVKNKNQNRKLKAEIISEKSRALRPVSDRIDKAEHEIITLEEKSALLHKQMDDAASAMDSSLLSELCSEIGKVDSAIEVLYDELNNITVEYEKLLSFYDEKLEEFS